MPSPPTISGASANQATSYEAPKRVFAGVTLTDPNGGSDDLLTITLSGAGGYLVEASAYTGLAILNYGSGAYSLRGRADQIQAALQGLQFVANAGTASAPATTNFALNFGSILNGAVVASASDATTAIADSDPAVAPTLSFTPSTVTTTWRQPVAPFLGVSLNNPNPGTTQTLTIALSGAGGTLAFPGGAPLPVSNQTYSFTGDTRTLAQDLTQLVFTPTAGGTTRFTVTDTVSGAASATSGPVLAQVITDDSSLHGKAGFQIGTPTSATVYFTQPFAPFAGGSFANLYPGSTVVDITLSGPAQGSLTATGAPITLASTSGGYRLTGTEAQVASALDDLIFTPRILDEEAQSNVTLNFTLTASTGDTTSTSQALTISDKPHVAIVWNLAAGQSATVETAYQAPVTPFTKVSLDDPGINYTASETLTITVSGNGALTYASPVDGHTSPPTGDGVTYTLTGSLGQVNNELHGLIFTPGSNSAGTTTPTQFTLAASSQNTLGTSSPFAQDSRAQVIDVVPATPPALAITALYQNATLTSSGEQASTSVTLAGTNNPSDAGNLLGVYHGADQLGTTAASASGAWNLGVTLPGGAATSLMATYGGGVGFSFTDAPSPVSGAAYAFTLGQGLTDVVGVDNAGDVVGDYSADAQGDLGVYWMRNGAASPIVSPTGDLSTKALGIDAAGDVLAQGLTQQTLFEYTASGVYAIFPNAVGIGIDAVGDVFYANRSTNAVYETPAGKSQAVLLNLTVASGTPLAVDAAGDVYGGAKILFFGASSATTLSATIAGAGGGYVWGGGGENAQAFVYKQTTGANAPVAPPGATATTIIGVPASGAAAGYYQTAASGADDFAFIEQGGLYTSFAPPGAVSTQFTGVTALGALIGQYTDASGAVHGFLDQNGVVQSFAVATPAGPLAPTPISAMSANGLQLAGAQGNIVFDESVACYGRGTRLRAERGDVAIEQLEIGDRLAVADGGFRPVVWLGRRRLDIARHVRPDEVRPVRVSADAFGPGQPRRDLRLSPGHNLALDDALIPVAALINGVTVAREDVGTVEYWHVELDAHDVILAEGLWAETYLDTGNRAAFENGGAYIAAHPDFSPRHWSQTCLPLMFEGPAVAAAKARLLTQCARQGHTVDEDADPHLAVDGRRIEPGLKSETHLVFNLPAGGSEIALCSRVFTPAHMDAQSRDTRTLGLCVRALQIDGTALALARDEFCVAGWGAAEFHGGQFSHRWTDGRTPLPPGARIVEVDLRGAGRYWRRADEVREKPAASVRSSRRHASER